jgi:glycosyltransferase involved in cell wall biosynthesis
LSRLPIGEAARWRLIDARNRLFDRFALRQVQRRRPGAVLSHPSCCLRTLQWCRREGIPFGVALPLAHPRTVRRIRDEEAIRRPEWSGYWDLADRPPALERRYEEELRLADFILCPSEFVARSCAEAGLPRRKLLLTPYGAEPLADDTLDEGRRERSREDKPVRFLFAGYLSQRKGLGYLLEAFRQLPSGLATLDLAGDWHRGGEGFRPLPEGVRWLGKLAPDDLAQTMARSDVFVFPSLCEGSALVVYEAMVAGLPLIVTPEAGCPEAGPSALGVSSADAGALADAMRACLNRERLGTLQAEAWTRRDAWTWERSRQHLRETVEDFLAG